jgi:hypothetical protein
MTNKEIVVIKRIEDWYLVDNGTYIKVYDATKSPCLLPQFVPYKIVLQEVAYQTVIHGVGGMLYRGKKEIWPRIPLYISVYSFSNTKKEEGEVNILFSYHFGEERSRRHDPKGVIKEHFNKVEFPWEYTTEVWEEEEVHHSARNYNDFTFKIMGIPLGRIPDDNKA